MGQEGKIDQSDMYDMIHKFESNVSNGTASLGEIFKNV